MTDLQITNEPENIIGNLIYNILPELILDNARGYEFEDYVEMLKEYKNDNVLILQPPINLPHKVKNKHADFSLYYNGLKYCIEVKRSNDTNTIYESFEYHKHTNKEVYITVLVGNIYYNLERNKKAYENNGIELLTVEEFEMFLSGL